MSASSQLTASARAVLVCLMMSAFGIPPAAAAPFGAVADPASRLYQLHVNGSIWLYTGQPCQGERCVGWVKLDANPATVRIAAAGNELFQLHSSGAIWRYTGTPCSATACPGWQKLDRNPATVDIVAAADGLYQLHRDGSVWQWTGTACNGEACTGWRRIEKHGPTVQIAVTMGRLYQRQSSGNLLMYPSWYTKHCTSDVSCSGWVRLDNNPSTNGVVVAASNVRHVEYRPSWADDTHRSNEGFALYQTHANGEIWRSTGSPCVKETCPGWQKIDNNPNLAMIAAGGDRLFQLHKSGQLWRFTGEACGINFCPGWRQIDRNPQTASIAASSTDLYQLHRNGRIWRWTGVDCRAESCVGWQLLDVNPATRAIVAASVLDPKLQRIEQYVTTGMCTNYLWRWSRYQGIEDDFVMDQCTKLLGIDAECASKGASVMVEHTTINGGHENRRFLFCQPRTRDYDVFEQISLIGKGVADGLSDAFVAAAPYLGTAVTGVGCANGVLYACAVLALDVANLASGNAVLDIAPDALKAAKQVGECVNGDIASCASLGYRAAKAAARAADVKLPGMNAGAVADAALRCKDGDFASCVQLGRMAGEAAGIPVGAGIVVVTDAQACVAGNPEACAALGRHMADLGVPLGSVPQGAELVLRCRNGESAACVQLGKAAAGNARI